MIASLSGVIAQKEPDMLVIDVNGVGYRVRIPFSTYFQLPDQGEKALLHVHTHVKEDAIQLFGFKSIIEKKCFQLLLTVSGIGPKLSCDILSNIEPADLADAIAKGSITRLSALPGIGKKTAERMILELREKIAKSGFAESKGTPSSKAQNQGVMDDVASALVNLGYKEPQVLKVLEQIKTGEPLQMEDMLKMGLKLLMKQI